MNLCNRNEKGFNLVKVLIVVLLYASGSQAVPPNWCSNYRYCPIWKQYINNGYTSLLILYNSCECGTQGSKGDIKPTTTTTTTTTTSTTTTTPTTPASGLLSEPQCGMSSQIYSASSYLGSNAMRIVGGTTAAECEFPWMAVIRDDQGRICAGSLIDKRHVLTAGHCVERGLARAKNMRVGLGSSDRREGSRMQYINADRVYRHPRYSPNNHDIAIMRLERAVTYTSCIQPICMATRPISVRVGTLCLASGWGLLKEGSYTVPNILQEVKVAIVSNAVCRRSYSGIDANKICAGFPEGGKDACQGDSGGPLACAIGKQWVMIGAVSYGRGCARPGFPGVYTYLPNYYSWIDQVRRS